MNFVLVCNQEELYTMHGPDLRLVFDSITRRILVGALHDLREKASQRINMYIYLILYNTIFNCQAIISLPFALQKPSECLNTTKQERIRTRIIK